MMSREQKTIKSLFNNLKCAPLQSFPNHREQMDAPDRRGVYVIYSP
jgi:hypothetical protein